MNLKKSSQEILPSADSQCVDDIVKEFLVESTENLDRLDRNLVELEKSPRDQELLADIFRTIHSIKGTTGFLGFHHLEAVAHAGENLLSRLRDGLLELNPEITSGLLAMVDAIREMLKLIESTEADGDNNYTELIASINLLMGDAVKTVGSAAPLVAEPQPPAVPAVAAKADLVEAQPQHKADLQVRSGEDRRKQDIPVDVERRSGKDRRENSADSNIRVDVSLLERLMDLVGELVLTRNQIIQFAAAQRDSSFAGASQKLNLVTSDMREIIMKTRLQPIQNVMGKFPRMVRDLAIACEKQVRIETTGQETELDRTILEAIKDPLTHAVRTPWTTALRPPQCVWRRASLRKGCSAFARFMKVGRSI